MGQKQQPLTCIYCEGYMLPTKSTWHTSIWTCAHCGAERIIDVVRGKSYWRDPLFPIKEPE